MTPRVNWDEPLEDMDGNAATLLTKNFRDGGWYDLYVVQVELSRSKSVLRYYYPDGEPHLPATSPGVFRHKIRNRKEERVGWINIYYCTSDPQKNLITGQQVFPTQEAAEAIGTSYASQSGYNRTHVCAVKIEVKI